MNYRRIIPNSISALSLTFGVLSIFDTFEGNFSRAAIFIILAVIADSMDGRAARFLGVGGGEFGKELDSLCDLGSFGVDPGDHFKIEAGAFLKARAELPVMENVNLITTADFFTPYNKDFGNVDVNWDVLISMKINKVLSATLNMTLKYDNDVKTFNDEGVERGPKVQFKEILGVGLAYNF